MGTNMYFAKRPEIIFMDYNEVIKSPTLFMINMIRGPLAKVYNKFINVEYLQSLTPEEIDIYLLQRKNKNIFQDLAITEFNYEKAYNDLYKKFDDMYLRIPLMKIGETIDYLVNHKFTKIVYFYSAEYDPRIQIDINYSFKDTSKIKYVWGDLTDVLNKIEQPTSYFLNDAWTIPQLVFAKKTELTDILCARYAFNLKYNEELDEVEPVVLIQRYANESVFKFAFFSPLNLNHKHTEILEKVL